LGNIQRVVQTTDSARMPDASLPICYLTKYGVGLHTRHMTGIQNLHPTRPIIVGTLFSGVQG